MVQQPGLRDRPGLRRPGVEQGETAHVQPQVGLAADPGQLGGAVGDGQPPGAGVPLGERVGEAEVDNTPGVGGPPPRAHRAGDVDRSVHPQVPLVVTGRLQRQDGADGVAVERAQPQGRRDAGPTAEHPDEFPGGVGGGGEVFDGEQVSVRRSPGRFQPA